MGLLDQILGGAAGGALGGRGSPFGRSGLGGGKAALVMALLPVVLRMLSNRQRGASSGHPGAGGPPVAADGGTGGLGGVLGAILGGGAAGSATGGTGSISGMGGLGGLLEQLTRRGFGPQAQSWVSTGPNQPLPREALDDLLGPQEVSAIARQAGVDEDQVRDGLAEVLPEVVDRLTPAGQVPGQQELLDSIDAFERSLPTA